MPCSMNQGREHILSLMKEKQLIEKKLSDLFTSLKQSGIDMQDALIDSEGYPRSDIDVATIRWQRHEIRCLQTDLNQIMQQIEKGLHSLHASYQSAKSMNETGTEEAFAYVQSVAVSSPAASAGLKQGDQLIQFGSLSASNFNSLMDLQTIVGHSRGRPIFVVVRRAGNVCYLTVVPEIWSGPGLLGCHFLPMEQIDR